MDFEYLDHNGNRPGWGFNVKPLGEGSTFRRNGIQSSDHAPIHVTFRLVDGSQPEDWNPDHGDRPCHHNGHDGTHPLNGCPDIFAAMEPDPTIEGWRENR